MLAYDVLWSGRLAAKANGRLRRALAWMLARSGDSLFWFLVIAILFWQRRAIAWDLTWAVVVTAVTVAILKGVFRRQRPAPKWAIATDKYSFPSGHAARAAAVAISLAFAQPAFSLLWLFWAGLVALARVALARHYLTDVGGGLLVGIVTGLVLVPF